MNDVLNQLEQELSNSKFKEWFRENIGSWLSEVTARKSELYPGNKKHFAGNAKLFPLKPTDHWSVSGPSGKTIGWSCQTYGALQLGVQAS